MESHPGAPFSCSGRDNLGCLVKTDSVTRVTAAGTSIRHNRNVGRHRVWIVVNALPESQVSDSTTGHVVGIKLSRPRQALGGVCFCRPSIHMTFE